MKNLKIVKDNMFPVPQLFNIIRDQSDTSWFEMYKVYNMGHRFEIYLPPEYAENIISLSNDFNIDARIIGRCFSSEKKSLNIKSEFGDFLY